MRAKSRLNVLLFYSVTNIFSFPHIVRADGGALGREGGWTDGQSVSQSVGHTDEPLVSI